MRYRQLTLLIIFLSSTLIPAFGQQTVWESWLEERMSASETEIEPDELAFLIDYYRQHPLNINTATENELAALPLFNALQIQQLISYREQYGGFESIYELALVDGFSESEVTQFAPFIVVLPTSGTAISDTSRKWFNRPSHSMLLSYSQTIEKAKGYWQTVDTTGNQRYLGKPGRGLIKYRFSASQRLEAGFTIDKDPGEKAFTKGRPLGDFNSAYVQLKPNGFVSNVLLGDFHARFGQGLTFCSSGLYGKSSQVLSGMQSFNGFSPYRSANETRFMRGAAITAGSERFNTSIFYSYRQLDVTSAQIDSSGRLQSFGGFDESGLHATYNQNKNRGLLTEQVSGVHLQLKTTHFLVGLTQVSTLYSAPKLNPPDWYKANSPEGDESQVTGIDYRFSANRLLIFGETALQWPGTIATLNGALFKLTSSLSGLLLYRSYPSAYYNRYTSAFGWNSTNNNEQGFYAGFEVMIAEKFPLQCYLDVVRFPWLKYRANAPSTAEDFYIKTRLPLGGRRILNLQFKHKRSEINTSESMATRYLVNEFRNQLRADFDIRLSRKVSLQTRFQGVYYRQEGQPSESGYLVYQQAEWLPTYQLSLSSRVAWFSAQSYNARLYAYETQLSSSFSMFMYYEKGLRTYLFVGWRVGYLNFQARYAYTLYPGKTAIGSGLNELASASRNDIGLQLKVDF